MKSLNPKQVLDPTWICQAHAVDLEYYTYLLLGAQQTYLKNLKNGRFDNFYEIAFHYLNLNTVIADRKLYDSGLKPISTNINLVTLISQLAQKDASQGKEIIKKTSKILAETMDQYLEKQIHSLEKIHFYFNNNWIHKQDRVYFVCKSAEPDEYEVVKLNLKSSRNFGYSVASMLTINLPNLKENEFKERLLEHKPILKDFKPESNVMVIGGGLNLDPVKRVCLAKDTILLNRIMNHTHGFDANVMLDFHRLLQKQKSIPFKLKAN
jgi:hypothetical protein